MFKDYSLVLNIMLKNSFRSNSKDNKKQKIIFIIAFFFGITPIIGLVSYMAYKLGQVTPIEFQSNLITAIFFSAQLMTIFFGIFAIINQMFVSKDTAFLNALPVRTISVYLAKMTLVYISELFISTLIILPTLISVGAGLSSVGFSISAMFYVLAVLSLFLIPLIPLFVISLLAFPLMYIVTFFKNRTFLTTVVTISLMIGFITLYFGAVGSFNGDTSGIQTSIIGYLDNIGNIAFFNMYLSNSMLAVGNMFVNLLIFIAIVLGSVVISSYLSSKLYIKGMTLQLEEAVIQGKIEEIQEQKTATMAVLGREVKMLLRNPSFALQCLMSPIMVPLLLVFFVVFGTSGMEMQGGVAAEIDIVLASYGMAMYFCILMLHGMNYVSAVGITREGSYFYINKYLPVSYKHLINGKILFALISAGVGILLSSIIMAVFIETNIINLLLFIVINCIYAYGFVCLGLHRDLRKPKLDWVNVQEAVKRNFSAMVPMLYAMVIGMIPLIIFYSMKGVMGWVLMWSTNFFFAAVIAIFNSRRLYSNYAKLIDNIVD